MPVIVAFDVAVTVRAMIEGHITVEAEPAQPGSWHWIFGYEVHWRPQTYWMPGTDVTGTDRRWRPRTTRWTWPTSD